MKIITYNIWDLPLWFVRNRKKRLLEIGRLLTTQGADIICLQESWTLDHRKALSEYIRAEGYHDAVHQENIKRANGGLLTFSKFPIRSVRFIPFGRRGLSISEIIGNKGVLETIVETPKGLLRILNIHLHHQSSKLIKTKKIRLRQLRIVFATLKKETSLPTILAGDFNENNMMEEVSFKKVFEKAGYIHHGSSTEVLPTYRIENYFVNNWLNRVPQSQRYDYILTKDIEQGGLHFHSYTPWYISPALSDHDPVVLTLAYHSSPPLHLRMNKLNI
jgi:endonuclease/exonuclease/phosphatase family metal-dependent hydrolase